MLLLLVSILTGRLLTRPIAATRALAWGLAIVVGLGTTGLVLGGSCMAGLSPASGMALALALAAGLWLARSRSRIGFVRPARDTAAPWLSRSVTWAMGISIACAAFGLATLFRAYPSGLWDAVFIYNLKARLLLWPDPWTGSWHALTSLSGAASHADYPLLVPLLVAGSSLDICAAGLPFHFAGVLVHVAFLVGLLLVVGGALALGGGRTLGLASVAVLLATPSLLRHSAAQYADIPLAGFLATAGVLLTLVRRTDGGRSLPLTIGLVLAAACWTKSEGVLYLLLLIPALLLARYPLRDMALTLEVAGIGLVLWAAMQLRMPVNDVAGGLWASGLAAALDPHRLAQLFGIFANKLLHFGSWVVTPLPVVALLVAGVALRRPRQPAPRSGLGLWLGLILLADIGVYAVTPHPLKWHMENSLSRLLLQIFPLAVFAFLDWCAARTRLPETTDEHDPLK